VFTEGGQLLEGGVQGLGTLREFEINEKDVFAHLPLGGARFNPTHIQTPVGKAAQGLEQGSWLVGME
jgi:hypothetical protein